MLCFREIGLSLIFINGCLITAAYIFYELKYRISQKRDGFLEDGIKNMVFLKIKKKNNNPVIGHTFKMKKKEFLYGE